jgi:uncharacterized protein (DUF1810 family)
MTAAPVLQRHAGDGLADATADLQLRLLDGRFAACPAQLAIRTIPPRSFGPDPLEVARCL